MTIVKYKLVASASRPFNPLENKGVTETRKEILSAYAASVRERLGMSLAEVASEDHVIPGTISDVLVCLKKPESVHAVVLGITNLAKGEYRTQLANNPQVTAFLARALRSTSSLTAKHARSAIRTLMSPNFNGIQLKNNPDMIRELSTSLGQAGDDSVTPAEDDSVTTVVSAIETLAMSDANSRELAKQSELVAYLCDAMEDKAPWNAQSAAWLLEKLTKLEANRDVLTRHEEVIPGLVRALSSETTIWPAALALDHLNQLGVLKDKPAVVLYLLSNTSVLNQQWVIHRNNVSPFASDFSDKLATQVTTCREQLRKSLLSTTRGPIYTDAFKTAMETYLRSLTVSVDPNSSAAEVEFFTKVEFFTNRADEVMVFAEAVIPKSMVSLYAFEREKGVYFLRSIQGLHMMLSAMPDTMLSMPDTMFSEMPDSNRKTTLMERKKNLMERQKNLMERLWPTPKKVQMKMDEMEMEIAQHTADPKIRQKILEYEANRQDLGRPALGEVHHDHQDISMVCSATLDQLSTASVAEVPIQYLYPTFPIGTLSNSALGTIYYNNGIAIMAHT